MTNVYNKFKNIILNNHFLKNYLAKNYFQVIKLRIENYPLIQKKRNDL